MSIKVSVIIPVYNAENYLTECIESLLSQTLKDCEFIFVNDGSRDKSREIIEEYKKKDPRIKLINKENEGVSIARNSGLAFASGDYVGFVDADDYVEDDMFETLYHAVYEQNCDAVISNFETNLEGHQVFIKYPFPLNQNLDKKFIQEELLPYFIKEDNLNSVCNKIYRNKTIQQYGILFPERIALGEDGMFNMVFFSKSNTISYLDYIGYHYREVQGSATRSIIKKDYFSKALTTYTIQLPEIYHEILSQTEIDKLKTIKFIRSVMANIHIYFNSSKEVAFIRRYHYIKRMIHHKEVRDALPLYDEIFSNKLSRYEKYLLQMMKWKSTLGLFVMTAYSRYRNN